MPPHYTDDTVTLHHGDCLNVLVTMPDASVDAVCTDPPYALSFMGRAWDTHDTPLAFQQWCEQWAAECLRVLKPGGHMLAFGGTRTWHRLACAIEDAGFEIRDSIFWLYGSGFPKSLNVSKDARFCKCDAVASSHGSTQRIDLLERRGSGDSVRSVRNVGEASTEPGEAQRADLLLSQLSQQGARRTTTGERIRRDGEAGPVPVRSGESGMEGRGNAQAAEGELYGSAVRPLPTGVSGNGEVGRLRDGAPLSNGAVDWTSTDSERVREPHQPRPLGQPTGELGSLADERGSQAWRGWPLCAGCGKPRIPTGLGTALKPSAEPVVVARKPLSGTVAQTVLAHGTGAINIDGCRVEHSSAADLATSQAKNPGRTDAVTSGVYGAGRPQQSVNTAGRWPTNVVLDEASAAELDQQSGTSKSTPVGFNGAPQTVLNAATPSRGFHDTDHRGEGYVDEGGASRFFPVFRYQAKAPTMERPRDGDAAHPTVKPLDLMRWLVRLVTPPGGTVLDPFAGSGTTGEACVIEGVRAILIERDPGYLPLIVARLSKTIQPDLFGIIADDAPVPEWPR